MKNIGGYTVQEVTDALASIAPIMQQSWNKAIENDELWRRRAKVHGQVRTWLLRRKLKKEQARKQQEVTQ